MKMFHPGHSSVEKESKPKKLDMQTLMFLIERFEKANQLEAAYSLIEIAREYFPALLIYLCCRRYYFEVGKAGKTKRG